MRTMWNICARGLWFVGGALGAIVGLAVLDCYCIENEGDTRFFKKRYYKNSYPEL